MLHLDHMLYAVPDLQQGIEDFEKLTGVRPVYGGTHPHLGTHNALVSLGEERYLELIAPDPNHHVSHEGMIYDIGNIVVPTIVTWAVRSTNINKLATKMRLSGVEDGQRIREDGACLKWKTAAFAEFTDRSGIVPFVIQWIGTPHPAATSPSGCQLLQFAAEHPSPHTFAALVSALSFPFPIAESPSFRLTVKIHSPKGVMEL